MLRLRRPIMQVRLILLLLCGVPSLLCAKDARPNLIFLFTDDQCTYSLGCYGNKDVKTPHIDSLAADGMAFDHHYDTTAICMASRATVMTGLYEYRHGCNFDHGPLLEAHWQKSYPMRLRKAGYRTAIAGKVGFLVQPASGGKAVLPAGDFDKWGGGPGQTHYQTRKNPSMAAYADKYPHSSRSYGAFGRDFIEESVKTGKPYCLSISFKAPHKPDQPDPAFDHVYKGKTFQKPPNYGREYGKHFSQQSRMGRQYERFVSWGYRDRYDEAMATCHQLVYAVDAAVGMVREAVRNSGQAENTVIIFTSDNGFLCGSHGYGSKVLPYEEASKVPLIIYDPRHKSAGKKLRCDSLTGAIDIAPTLLDFAGVTAPEGIDGLSLRPLLDDPKARLHDAVTLMNVWGPAAVHSLAVVTQDHKYIYWPYSKGDLKPAEELYHLAKDPLELRNLASDPGGDLDALDALHAVYDEALQHWKDHAVDYHGYAPFGKTFTRKPGKLGARRPRRE